MSHSTLVGGSTAGRLIQCPGFKKLAADLPPFTGNKYTTQGTGLHTCCEMMLANDEINPRDFVDQVMPNGYVVTDDDIEDLVIPAWNAWLDFSEKAEIDVYAEEQVVHFQSPGLEGAFGTADIIATTENSDFTFVIDWKFGRSPVDPEENSQGLFYAAAAAQDPETVDLFDKAKRIGVVIIQPQVSDYAVSWMTETERLNDFTADLTEAVELSQREDPPLAEGKYCQFCPAMANCPLKQQAVAELTKSEVTAANLQEILEVADSVEATIKAAREMAHGLLSRGVAVPGWGLKPKRSTRQWVEDDEGKTAEEKCKLMRKLKGPDYYNQKLKTPAQLEKVCKQKGVDFSKLKPYIASISSGTNLVKTDDPTPVNRPTRVIPKALADQMNTDTQ